MEKIKYKTIPHDAIISIEVSGAFYNNLSNLLLHLSSSVSEEEFKAMLEALKENKPAKNITEFNIHMLFSLIYEIEKNAKNQNKVVTTEIDLSKDSAEKKTT